MLPKYDTKHDTKYYTKYVVQISYKIGAVSDVCVALLNLSSYSKSIIMVAKYVAYADDNFVAKYVQNMMTIINHVTTMFIV